MFLKSIRGRLSLTYAAIALLVALSLGGVLLVTLRLYYQGQEYAYLQHNAQVMVAPLSGYLQGWAGLPDESSTLQSLSFLTRTRIRLLDARGQTLADSGSPAPSQINLAYKENVTTQGPETNFSGSLMLLTRPSGITQSENASGAISAQPQPDPPKTGAQIFTFSLPVNASLFGLALNSNLGPQGTTPSTQVVLQPIFDTTGSTLGYVQLSEGPAYGREIENSVARGWAISSGVAVLLALLAGWWFSRRISAPVAELTGVTQRMASGDLAARAAEDQAGEFGMLGRSFNAMAAQVEGTILTLRRFAADAAHELRTPLTALHTYLELAEREQANPAAPLQSLEQALEQVRRLEALTNDLLDLSRLETGANGAPLEDISLSSFVRETCEPYASQADQNEVSFALDLPAAELRVRGHPAQLRRALGNLLGNALKFTPSGGAISVRLLENDGQACLVVEDTGIGIPQEDLPYIFNRFHRGRNATAYPGSGLGLAIVRAIAVAHGGQVSVENASQGARFSLCLPLG